MQAGHHDDVRLDHDPRVAGHLDGQLAAQVLALAVTVTGPAPRRPHRCPLTTAGPRPAAHRRPAVARWYRITVQCVASRSRLAGGEQTRLGSAQPLDQLA